MSTVAQRKQAKRARRPVYMTVRRVVDPETGEMFGALVPANGVEQRLMRERGYAVGAEVRTEIRKPRNAAFHRLAHALGLFLVDHLVEFEGLDGHTALKRLQREAGVCCESQEIDLGALGVVTVKVPESLAFDEMDEGRFQEFWTGVTTHLRNTYAKKFSDREWSEVMQMIQGGQG